MSPRKVRVRVEVRVRVSTDAEPWQMTNIYANASAQVRVRVMVRVRVRVRRPPPARLAALLDRERHRHLPVLQLPCQLRGERRGGRLALQLGERVLHPGQQIDVPIGRDVRRRGEHLERVRVSMRVRARVRGRVSVRSTVRVSVRLSVRAELERVTLSASASHAAALCSCDAYRSLRHSCRRVMVLAAACRHDSAPTILCSTRLAQSLVSICTIACTERCRPDESHLDASTAALRPPGTPSRMSGATSGAASIAASMADSSMLCIGAPTAATHWRRLAAVLAEDFGSKGALKADVFCRETQ